MTDTNALHTGATPEYADAMMKFLGDRKPLEVFAQTPADLRKSVAGLTDKQLQTPEKPGKWSIAAVVQHVADVEIVLGFRYRKVLGQPGTPLPAIDQDAWAGRLGYITADVPAALDDFDTLRRMNLRSSAASPPSNGNSTAFTKNAAAKPCTTSSVSTPPTIATTSTKSIASKKRF